MLTRFVSRFAVLLLCSVTGCVYQARPGATASGLSGTGSSPEPIRGKYSMGAGDALGERMFIDNGLARGPVLIETAALDRD
jgi:hypothetical protein